MSELAVTKVASRSMTTQPVRAFPAICSHGNPAGVSSISCHMCARALARARAILSSMAAVPAGGDHPPAGEQHDLARGGQGQQVSDELVARAGPVDAERDNSRPGQVEK